MGTLIASASVRRVRIAMLDVPANDRVAVVKHTGDKHDSTAGVAPAALVLKSVTSTPLHADDATALHRKRQLAVFQCQRLFAE